MRVIGALGLVAVLSPPSATAQASPVAWRRSTTASPLKRTAPEACAMPCPLAAMLGVRMSVTDDIPGSTSAVTTAEALGVELARGLRARAGVMGKGVTGFARALSLDANRLQIELTYLSVFTTQFALGAALGTGDPAARVGAAFEGALWSGAPWHASAEGLTARLREYRDAFNHPHPELGRAYVIGRTFARHCHCTHEIAVIEFGARAYMDQLAPMVALLRSVTLR